MNFPPRLTKEVVIVPHISPSPLTPSHYIHHSPVVAELTASHLSDAQILSYLIIVFRNLKLRRQPCTLG